MPRPEDQIQDDPTFCEVCHLSDREDRMLLCDGCDCGYHLECLTPPMTEVPMEEWFCPECSQNSQNDAEAVYLHSIITSCSFNIYKLTRHNLNPIEEFF